jgi:hypothetical protein
MQGSKKTNKSTLGSECGSVPKKSLTEPTLLEMSGLRVYQALTIEAGVPGYCSQQVMQRRPCSRASSRNCCKSEPRHERILLSCLLSWKASLILATLLLIDSEKIIRGF